MSEFKRRHKNNGCASALRTFPVKLKSSSNYETSDMQRISSNYNKIKDYEKNPLPNYTESLSLEGCT